MTPKHLFILLLALFATSVAQNDDELHIPYENDNQFPPDNHSELDLNQAEGSGAEEVFEETTSSAASLIDDVQLSNILVNNESVTTDATPTCPSPCVCNIEGDSSKYIVDCSNSELTELPKSLDAKTTELNLQNNKLTEIPKDISTLKDLKILNVINNQIQDIRPGSISELPELTSLKLGNNRLIEYPLDLKNSFGLTKLEELDLGGNDMRTPLNAETFSNFKTLRKLILPSAASKLVDDVCASLKDSLETVCADSCDTKSIDCANDQPITEEELLDFVLPGVIAVGTEYIGDPNVSSIPEVNAESGNQGNAEIASVNDTATKTPVVDSSLNEENVIVPPVPSLETALNDPNPAVSADKVPSNGESNSTSVPINVETTPADGTEGLSSINQENTSVSAPSVKSEPEVEGPENSQTPLEKNSEPGNTSTSSTDEISFHSVVIKASPAETQPREAEITTKANTSLEKTATNTEEIVGATTSNTKTGGVDKSIIGMVVAGMVLVIAGITIKKNWSSIRNRFRSSPRSAHDRTAANTNGLAPEEVPLQEKSPV